MSTKEKSAPSVKGQKRPNVKSEGVIIAPINKEIIKESVKAENARQKLHYQNEARKILGVKTVNGKEISPSSKTVKIQATIEKLYDKENRTLNETKMLVNALSKMENLSASRIYDYMKNKTELVPYFLELCGAKELPTFKEFKDALPVKFMFSEWDVLGVLTKMNPKHKLNVKIERQNKATAKK